MTLETMTARSSGQYAGSRLVVSRLWLASIIQLSKRQRPLHSTKLTFSPGRFETLWSSPVIIDSSTSAGEAPTQTEELAPVISMLDFIASC
jgi:hypothetical protein